MRICRLLKFSALAIALRLVVGFLWLWRIIAQRYGQFPYRRTVVGG